MIIIHLMIHTLSTTEIAFTTTVHYPWTLLYQNSLNATLNLFPIFLIFLSFFQSKKGAQKSMLD